MNPLLALGALAALALFGLMGCGNNNQPADSNSNNNSNNTAASWSAYENRLQRSLFDVATSKTPAEAAARTGITQHMMAQVVIELQPGATLPVGFLVLVENEVDQLIQAWVRTDQILELAQRDEIRYIRMPAKPTTR